MGDTSSIEPIFGLILADDFLDDETLRNAVTPSFVCDGIYRAQVRKKPLRQQQTAVFDRLALLQERPAHPPVVTDRRRSGRV